MNIQPTEPAQDAAGQSARPSPVPGREDALSARFSAPNWQTRPISPTCEFWCSRDCLCGKPTAFAYPAYRGGWAACCEEHGQRHRPHITAIADLLAVGETLQPPAPSASQGSFESFKERWILDHEGSEWNEERYFEFGRAAWQAAERQAGEREKVLLSLCDYYRDQSQMTPGLETQVEALTARIAELENWKTHAEELFRAIRDGECNPEDSADNFVRDHTASPINKLRERIAQLEAALRVELAELIKRTEHRTHWDGCEKDTGDHPMCAAIMRIKQALAVQAEAKEGGV